MRRVGKSLLLLAPAILLAIQPLRLAAQVGPANNGGTGAATQPATQPAPAPGVGTTGTEIRIPTAPTRPTTQISMRFENASVDAVLEHLSRVAGFIIIKDTA